jgi:hypothetical protein
MDRQGIRRFIPKSLIGKIAAGSGVVFVALVVIGGLASSTQPAGSHTSAAPTPASSPAVRATQTPRPVRTRRTSTPKPAAAPAFPPRTMKAFLRFAATGDASEVQQIGYQTTGLPSCPDPTYTVLIPDLSVRATEADLSAFFVGKGLAANQCAPVVWAYYNRAQANAGNGYTAGIAIITTNSPGPPWNLEVAAGSAVDDTGSFSFNF